MNFGYAVTHLVLEGHIVRNADHIHTLIYSLTHPLFSFQMHINAQVNCRGEAKKRQGLNLNNFYEYTHSCARFKCLFCVVYLNISSLLHTSFLHIDRPWRATRLHVRSDAWIRVERREKKHKDYLYQAFHFDFSDFLCSDTLWKVFVCHFCHLFECYACVGVSGGQFP